MESMKNVVLVDIDRVTPTARRSGCFFPSEMGVKRLIS